MHDVGQGFHLDATHIELGRNIDETGLRYHEMGFERFDCRQFLEQTHAINGAAGPRYRNDDSSIHLRSG